MRLEDILLEVKGSPSFEYKYWFWAKKSPSTYGLGYARHDVKLDIQLKAEKELEDNLKDVKSFIDNKKELEVIEKKIKPNMKRISGIIELFKSPIVIFWLNNEPPTPVSIPLASDDDVIDENGRRIDVIGLFNENNTRSFITKYIDWDKVKINTENMTLNSIVAQFVKRIFSDENDEKIRTKARNIGLTVMKSVSFKTSDGIKVVPFKDQDYDLLPKNALGSKKIVSKLNDIIKENFNVILKTAIERLK